MSPILAAAATTGTGADAAALALSAAAFACARLWLEISRYAATDTAAAARSHGHLLRRCAGGGGSAGGGRVGSEVGTSRRAVVDAAADSGVRGEVSAGASRVVVCDGSSVTITGNSTSRIGAVRGGLRCVRGAGRRRSASRALALITLPGPPEFRGSTGPPIAAKVANRPPSPPSRRGGGSAPAWCKRRAGRERRRAAARAHSRLHRDLGMGTQPAVWRQRADACFASQRSRGWSASALACAIIHSAS